MLIINDVEAAKINITITKEDIGYSAHAFVCGKSINTEGDDYKDLKINVLDAVNLAFEDQSFVYTLAEIKFILELESFFDFYKVINAHS